MKPSQLTYNPRCNLNQIVVFGTVMWDGAWHNSVSDGIYNKKTSHIHISD